jgi:hypothetical protein
MKKTKILRNIFISVGVFFALVQQLAAGASDHLVVYGETPLTLPIITVDAPGAGTGPFQGTVTYAINPMGTIAGYYFDSNTVTHGFVRATDGTFVTFDAPRGGTGPYQGTFTGAINPAGGITGFVTCATRTAPSPRSMFQARGLDNSKARFPQTSTRQV